jgi:DNA-binding NtrC family response regulator
VESAAIMATGETIGIADFESVQLPGGPSRRVAPQPTPNGMETISVPAKATLADAERILIAEHLDRAKTKTEAARTLGIGLRTLYTKIQQLHLEGPPHTGASVRS